jgi:translation initiation factor 2 subunit 2
MRTYLVNYREIAQYLNRDPQHLLHYLSKELATAGTIDGARAIFQGKFGSDTLDRTIQRYIEEYIICPVCKRPDTKIVREKRLSFIVCEACGARNPVKTT